MDLNKIYPLLPEDSQKDIKRVIIKYLGPIAKECGFSLVEKSQSVDVSPNYPPPLPPIPEAQKEKNKYLTWPIILHGLSIPNKERLVDLYKDAKVRTWKGKLNWSKVQYYRNYHGMTLEEIFPEPPPPIARQTLIKRLDENGESYTPLG